tara:strand:- start:285 stop:509 length:225 start_codon:yes stop_codon:yes gene_type:complete
LSRVTSEITDGMHIEPGDCIVVIKKDGTVGKVVMPEMNVHMQNSVGYKKLLEVLDVIEPGAKKHFEDHNKGKLH